MRAHCTERVVSSYFTDATTDIMALFAVSRAQQQLVESYRPQIEKKFRVGVQLSTYADPTVAEGDGGRVTVGHGGRDESDGGQILLESQQMWVEIAGDDSGAAKAKEYILSLCDPGTASLKTMGRLQDGMTIREQLPYGFGDLLQGHLVKISAETNARIDRIGRTDELLLIGDETSIAMALSLIERECSKLRQGGSQTPSGMIQVTSSKEDAPGKRLLDEGELFRCTPPVKDSQGSTPAVRTNKPTESTANLSERTDQQPIKLIAHSISVPSPDVPPVNVQRQKSISLVSSMQKLGYPREQVDIILRQLGPEADHNDVLWALVNQSSSKTDFADVVDTKEDVETTRDVSDGFPSEEAADESDNLRPIIIDGSNVAMSFGNKVVFACKGIDVAVKWFCDRGHKKIHVFVPNWRKEASKPETPITDQEILTRLEQQKFLTWTPSRRSNGRRIVCYDDRYILRTAVEEDGIIVSNDNFRDIQNEKPEWRKVIEERLLMYAFVSERFMPPDDPLGRHGPSLDNFLRMKPTMPDHLPQACPYGKKCTYGNKCKYYHSDRPNRPIKSISETLKERDKTRRELAKLNSERSNSPRFSTAATAPIPGYRPPEEVTSSPDWHTTPLPGANTQWSPQRKSVVSDSGSLPASTKSGSPHHYYAKEPAPQAPYPSARDEVYLGQDQQRYHQNAGVPQSLSQVPSRHLNTPPLGRAGHTSPLPYPSNSQRANQQGMYTVPLQRYYPPSQPERGYGQFEESHNSNRLSMPATLYGSGESLGITPSGINVERRPSHELIPDFQRLGIQDPSGIQLPREPQHSYNYRQPQYHSGEQFPGQMPASHPADFNQGSTQPLPYHSRHQSPVMSSDQMMYSSPRRTVPQSYPSHSEPSRPNYPSSSLPSARGPYRPTEPAKMSSLEEQGRQQNILHHLSGIFGPKQVESVMRRHPTETNPQKLIGYMSTNT